MDIEFHYYVTAILAKKAGFTDEEAKILAYSSQYVDDNDKEIAVYLDDLTPVVSFENTITQTMDILRPRRDLMRIYPVFHFIPGDQPTPSNRQDGLWHDLLTTPDSSYAKKIYEQAKADALEQYSGGDKVSALCRLGIATHSYADTWAHQNFIGWWDDLNGMGTILPNIGHAEAKHDPDLVGYRWEDNRLANCQVDNNLRFLSASRSVFGHLQSFCLMAGGMTPGNWEEVEPFLREIFGQTYSETSYNEFDDTDRKERYCQFLGWDQKTDAYDPLSWLLEATTVKNAPVPGVEGFAERYVWNKPSENPITEWKWYKFQKAAEKQLACGVSVLQGPIFSKYNIDLSIV